ncbi:hypothetical protein [Rhizobium bangladeshense]|uniref:hypothetical protein n=1 Tax=Rhizobium bangladeshense TaxID=1138189 RepID=UPI001FEAE400|nr:hypothetical protein [Rhizobium bangladeshense]
MSFNPLPFSLQFPTYIKCYVRSADWHAGIEVLAMATANLHFIVFAAFSLELRRTVGV